MLIVKIIFSHFIFYVSVLLVCSYVYHSYAWCPWKSDPLKLELWEVVNSDVNFKNQIWFLCKSNKCSKALSHLSIPKVSRFLNDFLKRSLIVFLSPNTPSSSPPSPLLPLFNTNNFLIPLQF